jgi:hypothetical protein
LFAKAENVAEEMLLMDLLSDAHKITNRLKRRAGAIGGEQPGCEGTAHGDG